MAHVPLLIGMEEDEIMIHLRGEDRDTGIGMTSTPASGIPSWRRHFQDPEEVAAFCSPSADDERQRGQEDAQLEKERGKVETERALLRARQAEEALVTELRRSQAFMESLLERSAILGRQGPAQSVSGPLVCLH